MNAKPQTSGPADIIFDTATAFWKSHVLFTACGLGVFDELEKQPSGSSSLAASLGASERGLDMLLKACAAIGILEFKDGVFSNAEPAARYLTTRSDQTLVTAMQLQSATCGMWLRLEEAVRSGNPVIPPGNMIGSDPELTRRMIIGMHQRALGVAREVSNHIDLSGCRRLADIGGGPATYAAILAGKYPGLEITVMDLQPVLEIASGLLEDTNVKSRISLVPCNAETDDFGGDFDAVLISGLLHRMDSGQTISILSRAHRAMNNGACIFINDLFSRQDTEPEMAVLFGLQMLLTTARGRTHAVPDIEDCLREAGFKEIRSTTLPPPLPHTIIMARKT